METIDSKEFALAVISGNPVQGTSPENIAQEALKLYFEAYKLAEKHNESNQKDWLH